MMKDWPSLQYVTMIFLLWTASGTLVSRWFGKNTLELRSAPHPLLHLIPVEAQEVSKNSSYPFPSPLSAKNHRHLPQLCQYALDLSLVSHPQRSAPTDKVIFLPCWMPCWTRRCDFIPGLFTNCRCERPVSIPVILIKRIFNGNHRIPDKWQRSKDNVLKLIGYTAYVYGKKYGFSCNLLEKCTHFH